MMRWVSRGSHKPSFGGGSRGTRRVERLLSLVLAMSPAMLLGIEGADIAPIAKESLGKTLTKEGWDRDAPVDIHSEEMTVDFEKHQIVFKGDVKVLQSDFSLAASEVTAFFGESAEDILKIVAQGDVKIRKADKMAWGEQAVYERESATIRLTGNPVLKQGRNFIKGQEIRVSLDEDRMEVKGSVEAEFVLSGQKQGLDIRDQGTGVRE